MELGNAGVDWFVYEPEFMGNRELPEEERMSVELRRMSTLDVLSINSSPGGIRSWREKALAEMLKDEAKEEKVRNLPDDVLSTLRQFIEYTKNFNNFLFDGKQQTDPVRIFFDAPISPGGVSLVKEIVDAIAEAASLYGDDLKNYASQFAGSLPETTSPTSEDESSRPAPTAVIDMAKESTDPAQSSASTTPVLTESSN